MMNFGQIWSKFDWVIDEMKDGMCFFEGYLPSIDQDNLHLNLLELISDTQSHNFINSVWSDATNESDWEKEYSLLEYIKFFRADKILLLHCNYEKKIDDLVLTLELIFEKNTDVVTTLEVICYRESILESDNTKDAVSKAIYGFRYLKRLFQGDSLFIGPDTLNYPKNRDDNVREWLKME